MTKRRVLSVCLLVVAAVVIVISNRRPPAVKLVEQTLENLPPPPEEPTFTPDLRPPRVPEVVRTVERVFAGAVPGESVAAHQALSADFNGDRSPDLAVPVRVVEALLPAINDELANWIVQNPEQRAGLDAVQARLAAKVGSQDTLLAVVHGVGAGGWRNPVARQGYLLKTTLDGELTAIAMDRFARANAKVPHPRLWGDVLREVRGRRYLYWNGARYLWHPLVAPAGNARVSSTASSSSGS